MCCFFLTGCFTTLVFVGFSAFIRITIEYYKDKLSAIKWREMAASAELEALKSKINPHFLYNAFNSIYSLAESKSDQTSNAILKFANIMRYVTYKSSEKKVAIYEELKFIQSYIDFQCLRVYDPNQSKINISITPPKVNYLISPLLLLTFLENAFKHSNLNEEGSCINVEFKPNERGFCFGVSNNISIKVVNPPGYGLKTLTKILEHSYPNQHEMKVWNDGVKHYARLKLNLY